MEWCWNGVVWRGEFRKGEFEMEQLISDLLVQLGIYFIKRRKGEVLSFVTTKTYLHYDEIEPFVKFNCFKGISSEVNYGLALQFIV